MSLVLLNALLILAGPFLVVLPLAIAAHVQLSPRHPRSHPVRVPAWRPAFGGWVVA
jgi:hypothetical protein